MAGPSHQIVQLPTPILTPPHSGFLSDKSSRNELLNSGRRQTDVTMAPAITPVKMASSRPSFRDDSTLLPVKNTTTIPDVRYTPRPSTGPTSAQAVTTTATTSTPQRHSQAVRTAAITSSMAKLQIHTPGTRTKLSLHRDWNRKAKMARATGLITFINEVDDEVFPPGLESFEYLESSFHP